MGGAAPVALKNPSEVGGEGHRSTGISNGVLKGSIDGCVRCLMCDSHSSFRYLSPGLIPYNRR